MGGSIYSLGVDCHWFHSTSMISVITVIVLNPTNIAAEPSCQKLGVLSAAGAKEGCGEWG